jgi:hypothetical protein
MAVDTKSGSPEARRARQTPGVRRQITYRPACVAHEVLVLIEPSIKAGTPRPQFDDADATLGRQLLKVPVNRPETDTA